MPRKNPIAYLAPSVETPGATYHWKPSPKLRRLGWCNLKLGTDWREAVSAAKRRNREVAEAHPSFTRLTRRLDRLERHRAWVDRAIEQVKVEIARHSYRSRVYFIGTGEGPIKIGVSLNPRKRLATLQTGHSGKLRILASVRGGAQLEREYHERYARLRLGGEWFEPHPRILDEIERLKRRA